MEAKTTFEKIKSTLWKAAGTFRGTIDAANYKDFVLAMLFLKYLDDTHEEQVQNLHNKYGDNEIRIERAKARLPFVLSEDERFKTLYEKRFDVKIGEIINFALRGIEDSNTELHGVFRSIDFNSETMLGNPQQKNTKLRTLLEDFEPLDLMPSHIETTVGKEPADIIGDAYEYMIGEFAAEAGKKAGSFFTPTMVSELMARLTKPRNDEAIYDPTCGSASLLIRTAKQADVKKVAIYGQEMNGSSWSMARMNLFIHDIHGANIAWGDSLSNPLHLDSDGNLKQFDVIVANMPFSQDKWAEGFNPGAAQENAADSKKKFTMTASLDPYHRFDWGVPPASKGDWAFLLHMIHSLKNNGRMAAVVPHGVLFRGASEGRIRQTVIEKNLLDAVIGLPANLFFGTSIPACILVFKKNRATDDVLFIDASGKDSDGNLRYKKDKNQNKLEEKDIQAILDTYFARKDVDKFARKASFEEIKGNEFNLNIPRYVDTFEEEELIDIEEVQGNIDRIKGELVTVEAKMAEYLKELGL
ncbi:MAG TPA: type I restriction-modification system subunit M [Ruminococcaceae bacterium]|nr:type I restriction-modification system subunit M [Oscillospiraceae bacterium]